VSEQTPYRSPWGWVMEQHPATLRERAQMARTLLQVAGRAHGRVRLRLVARTARTVLSPSCQAAYYRVDR
jgi:hypothetical protein